MITGSVLVALALESWWVGLADVRAETEILASLEVEMEETRQEVLRARGVHRTRCEAATAMRAILERPPSGIDGKTLAILTRDLASVTSVDAPMGVLQGLISSGSLELIRDADLRSSLAGWPARLEDHREAEVFVHDVVRDQWVPWLVENAVLTSDWGRTEPEPLTASAEQALLSLPRNREFQNLVMMQDYYCSFIMGESERIETEIEELRARVAAQR